MIANDPAHPSTLFMGPNGEFCTPQYYGLTKRELIAAMMMQGSLTNPELGGSVSVMARSAVLFADALIAELSKEKP